MTIKSLATVPRDVNIIHPTRRTASLLPASLRRKRTNRAHIDINEARDEVERKFGGNFNGETKTITVKIPGYVKRQIQKMERRWLDEELTVQKGETIAALIYHTLREFMASDEAQSFKEELAECERLDDLSLFDEQQLGKTTDSFRIEVDDMKTGRETFSFRCRPDLFEYFVNCASAMRVELSSLLVPCLMAGLVNQPGTNPKSEGPMQEAYRKLHEVHGEDRYKNLHAFRLGLQSNGRE